MLEGTERRTPEYFYQLYRYYTTMTPSGVPHLATSEALHGLCNASATIFPQAITMAATMSRENAYNMGYVIGAEAAATGINEANVGMTATETVTTNPRVLGADPMVRYRKAEPYREGTARPLDDGKAVRGLVRESDAVVLQHVAGPLREGSLTDDDIREIREAVREGLYGKG